MLERTKLVVEPAGAAALGALLGGTLHLSPQATVVCVASGGNVDPAVLKSIL
jgi:threonine dehydratase